MKPINEWMIVEEVEPVETTASGIFIPGKENKGLVKHSKIISISADIKHILAEKKKDLHFGVGDTVCHHAQMGIQVDPTDNNNRTMWMKYDAVMGLVE